MKFSQRTNCLVKLLAVVLTLAVPVVLTLSTSADARIGGGGSSGSRGSRTFSAPPSTPTAPSAAQPMQRSATQPGVKTPAAGGGFFNRPGLLGGLAAGFLGAGLLGMLFGGGMFGGLGSLSSMFGLILQLGLLFIVVRLAMSWWQRRNAPAYANMASPNTSPAGMSGASGPQPGLQSNARGGFGFGTGSASAPLEIVASDYDTFERLLGDIQTAWSNEDINKIRTIASPEMVSYFGEDLTANNNRGVVNKVSDVKLLQGDLAEAWREGQTDFATLGMRFSLVDKTTERATGKVVDGSDTPVEVTEVWTFQRPRGGTWELSAIQQA